MIDIKKLFRDFNNLKVIVVGDVMIDAYLWGKVNRISPEAPVPVFDVVKKENRLGGAANVALNVQSLEAEVFICSVIGDDLNAGVMEDLFQNENLPVDGLIKSSDRKTTKKTRVIAQAQQMLRVDDEIVTEINTSEETKLIERVKELCSTKGIDVIIFEDYNKGVLSPKVIHSITDFANKNNIKTTVDPKRDNFFEYKNVTLFKPNLKELKEGLKVDFDVTKLEELRDNTKKLQEILNNTISLITLSEHGVFIKDQTSEELIPAHIRKIADVSGAGDTVISVASLLLALDVEKKYIAGIANLSGGLVCEKVGVVPIDKKQLLQEALKYYA